MSVAPDVAGIETAFMGVAHLLRDRQLEVPPYQRSYSWTRDEVLAYWHDLRASLVAEQPVYFLGTVVLTLGSEGRSTVIDGQQRLATTSMLLAAIRDVFQERGDEVSAAQVASQYVSSTSLVTQRTEPRILLNHVDRDAYLTVVVNREPPSPGLLDSNQRIVDCYNLLRSALRDDVGAAGPYWRQRLIAWIQMLDVRTRVIVVSVRDDADAFMIFETLNDRGLALTVADLVKNYLFGLARERIDQVEDRWVRATSHFDNGASSFEFTTFLRQWWSSTNGATRERDLYRRIRNNVTTETSAAQAIESISDAAPLFAAILNPEHEYWSRQDVALSEAVRVLLDLGLEQHRPLLLAAMKHLSPNELKRVLHGLISWSVRGLIVGGIGGGTTERYYAEAAVMLSAGRISSAQEVMASLEPIIPTDIDFQAQFAVRRIHKSGMLRYLLRALGDGAAVPATDERDFVALPVLTRPEYEPLLSLDEDDPLDKRIGNYLLVPKADTGEIRNSVEKRLGLVRQYARDADEWLHHGVNERQAALASAAVETWPRNIA